MIRDYTNGSLNEIKVYIQEHHLEESFTKTYTRYETFSKSGCDVNLYRHFASLSLGFEDILHYQKIIVALSETDRLINYVETFINNPGMHIPVNSLRRRAL